MLGETGFEQQMFQPGIKLREVRIPRVTLFNIGTRLLGDL